MTGAPAMVVWGTGAPRREFLHVDDLADVAILMEHFSEATTINVGVGKDVTIKELVAIICDVVGLKVNLSSIQSAGWHAANVVLHAFDRSAGRRMLNYETGLRQPTHGFWKILINCVRPNNDITTFHSMRRLRIPLVGYAKDKSGAVVIDWSFDPPPGYLSAPSIIRWPANSFARLFRQSFSRVGGDE